ncbi:asparaginase [Homoserinibacter sp. GY 40078]|uniref:asparaginase n=1 Tax=Homoserinibacter sp. GY 40078 TaxID=2603275 RepID=UPI001650710C|nr:asparaginase [Homoserinibacter sp. GY 40078]
MTALLDPASSVELCAVWRSEVPESRHLGAAAVVDPDGTLLASLGSPDALIYPRSTLKLVQATAVELAGVVLDQVATALTAASHAGTPRHVEVVRRILDHAGLDESSLRCPADWPADPVARRAADAPRPITMNCSGKHAGFLAACVANGWDTEGYLDPAHPMQRHVLELTSSLAGETLSTLGIDGCGAPVPLMSLVGLARAASRTARSGTALGDAIRSHPWAIDGPGRANTVTIEKTGLVAKLGAEGVLVLVTPDGASVAVKALDGSHRATTPAGLELLVREGLLARSTADAVLAEIGTPGLRVSF